MKNLLGLLLALSISIFSLSQEVIVERDVEEERSEDEENNIKNIFRYGVHILSSESDSLRITNVSPSLYYGSNGLIRLSKWNSLGIQLGFQVDNYKINQDSLTNLLSLGVENDRQRIHHYTAKLGLSDRIHLGKHGLKEGSYIEFGAFGSIRLTSRMLIRNELDPSAIGSFGAERVDAVFRRLQFVELLGYQAFGAIGRNNFSLYGEYRLSDIFKADESINQGRKLTELPRLNVGFRLEF